MPQPLQFRLGDSMEIPFFGKKEEKPKEEEEERAKGIIITPNILSKILDVQPFLEQIEYYLKGYVLRREGNQLVMKKPPGAKPRLSEEGIQEILKIMRMRLGEIYRLPNLDNNFVRWEVYFFNINIAELLARKAKDWNLDGEYYQETVDYLTSAFEAVLRMQLLRSLTVMQPQPKKEIGVEL